MQDIEDHVEQFNIKVDTATSSTTNHLKNFSSFMKAITVEPLLAAGNLVILLYSIVSSQYIFYRISKDYGLASVNVSNKCGNKSSDLLYQQVSAETSDWILYLNIAGFVPSFFCTLLVTAWGDKVGRRPPLFVIFLGFLLLVIIYIVVIALELPVAFLLLARILCGVCGDFSALLACCFAYFADVSPHSGRTLKMAVGSASLGIGGVVGNLISGPWIQAQGYENPLWLLFALSICSIVYIVFCLTESVTLSSDQPRNSCFGNVRRLFTFRPFVELWSALRNDHNNVKTASAVLGCLFLHSVAYDGILDIVVVYEKSPPFCWPSTFIGYAGALSESCFVVGLICVRLLNGHVSDVALLAMGIVSGCAYLLIFAFVTTTWALFVGIACGCLVSLPIAVLRSSLSRLSRARDQGAAFALVGCAQSLASVAGSAVFNSTYAATVGRFRGAAFVVAAGAYATVLAIFCVIYKKTRAASLISKPTYSGLDEDSSTA